MIIDLLLQAFVFRTLARMAVFALKMKLEDLIVIAQPQDTMDQFAIKEVSFMCFNLTVVSNCNYNWIYSICVIQLLRNFVQIIDCIWAEWNSWEQCSMTCGSQGTRKRSRSNTIPEAHGGTCNGGSLETERCNSTINCPRRKKCLSEFQRLTSSNRNLMVYTV